MTGLTISGGHPLRGSIGVPGDKSITHRSLLLGALAEGRSHVRGALLEGDCQATLGCVAALGVEVTRTDLGDAGVAISIAGRGLRGLRPPAGDLDCLRSGTTMRLLSGILAGQTFPSVLSGDPQLLRRPMDRVVVPLRRMGAQIEATDGHAPLYITGGQLHGIEYVTPVASAQVKSAILLAGLLAEGATTVQEPSPSRDHTERMLLAMGASLSRVNTSVTITPPRALSPVDLMVPGDISSAAFPLVAAAVVPGSDVVIRNVGLNPTRAGVLDVLRAMGADITLLEDHEAGGEPVGDLRVRAGPLRGVEIGGGLIPRLIDELPILAVAATQAEGQTVIRDAAELRVKETDRIENMVAGLRRLGATVEACPDGMIIEGPCRLRGAVVDGAGDHRVAMSLIVAGLLADGITRVEGAACASDSFPGFVELLHALGAEVNG